METNVLERSRENTRASSIMECAPRDRSHSSGGKNNNTA
jgi:hypothetical protein